jgi:hypothetical protein
MTDTSARPTPQADGTAGPTAMAEPATGWVGWVVFGAVMLMVAGSMEAITGLIALLNDEWVVWGNQANLYLDLTQWGWIHIALGAALVGTGIGLMVGNIVARAVGVIVAVLSIIGNFLFMPAYPVWSLVVVTLNVLVIWAITAHGREVRAS